MCLWTKSKNTTTTKQKFKPKKPCRSRELNPGSLAPKADALPLHHRVNGEYRLFRSYLNVSMGRNVNKQIELRARHFQHIFCHIFTCMNNYIWQFLIFTGLCFTA